MPLQPGCRINYAKGLDNQRATMCCFVYDAGGIYLLTSGHCLEGCQTFVEYDGDKPGADALNGRVIFNLVMDAAIAKVMNPKDLKPDNFQVADDNVTLVRTESGLGGLPRDVKFSGARTRDELGLTQAQAVRAVPTTRPDSKRAEFELANGTFWSGDSGGPIYTDGGALLGIFFQSDAPADGKRSGKQGFALDITEVMSQLGVSLATWGNRPAWINPAPVVSNAPKRSCCIIL